MDDRGGARPITVVRAAERTIPRAAQTPGMRREQAFASEDRWVGHVTTSPGVSSGWHHHGDYDTYFYVLAGTVRMEFGQGGRTILEVRAGDFCLVPKGVVHRESTVSPDPGQLVLVRVGRGVPVVNVDGPDPA